MSLLDYESRFAKLRMRNNAEEKSPHKVCMLKAVMQLIEQNIITDNRIYYNENLLMAFSAQISPFLGKGVKDSPYNPYFHLRSERFWHHQVNGHNQEKYSQTTGISSDKAARELIDHVYLDDELFELLQLSTVRTLLAHALDQNISDNDRLDILLDGDAWTALECEAIVSDYFTMLHNDLAGIAYDKAQHRRALQQKLNNRTEGAIEFKHQNISAILITSGLPYIADYKPLYNYQSSLQNIVLAYIAANGADIEKDLINELENTQKVADHGSWADIIVEPPISDTPVTNNEVENLRLKRAFLGRFVDYAKKDHNNRNLGRAGEEFVLLFERQKLLRSPHSNLAKSIKWSSNDEGDGLGYDIRSFNETTGDELFIEVKTTRQGKYQPFYISKNEVDFSQQNSTQYSLYRVFDYRNSPRIFLLQGDVRKHAKLAPQTFIARF